MKKIKNTAAFLAAATLTFAGFAVQSSAASVDITGDETEIETSVATSSIANCTVTLGTSSVVYTGKAVQPDVTVTDENGNLLVADVDYTVEYSDNILPGKAAVTVSGLGLWDGTATANFNILPIGVTAKTAYTASSTSVKIAWNKVTGADGYTVLRWNGSKWVTVGTTAATSYTNKSLKSGTTYKFKVKAYVDIDGTAVSGAASDKITTSTKPAQVKLKTAYTSTDSRIRIKWNKVTGASGYQIFRYKNGGWVKVKTVGSGVTNYLGTGLKSNTAYKYKVKAYRKVGGKTLVGEASKTFTARTKPSKVTVKSGYTSAKNAVKFSWKKVNCTGYQIFRYNGKKWVKVKTIKSANTTSYKATGLKAGTVYKYKVRAYTKSGGKTYYGAYSATKATATVPNATTITKTNKSSNAVRLTWKKVNCTGYQIWSNKSGKWKKIKTIKSANTTTYRITGLKGNKKYQFKVRPYTSAGGKVINGKATAIKVVKTDKAKDVPKPDYSRFTSIKVSGTSCKLSWEGVKCDGYDIWMCPGNKGFSEFNKSLYRLAVDIKDSSITTATVKDLCEYSRYTVQVLPYNLKSDGTKVYGFYNLSNNVNDKDFETEASYVIEPSCKTTKYKRTVTVDYAETFKMLKLVNAERKKVGSDPLIMDAKLMEIAVQRCAENLDNLSPEHTRPNGQYCVAIAEVNGENIYGSVTLDVAEMAVESWLGDPGHKGNMLNSAWKSTGMAIITTSDGYTLAVTDFSWDEATTKATQPANGKKTVTVETKFPYTWVY